MSRGRSGDAAYLARMRAAQCAQDENRESIHTEADGTTVRNPLKIVFLNESPPLDTAETARLFNLKKGSSDAELKASEEAVNNPHMRSSR